MLFISKPTNIFKTSRKMRIHGAGQVHEGVKFILSVEINSLLITVLKYKYHVSVASKTSKYGLENIKYLPNLKKMLISLY